MSNVEEMEDEKMEDAAMACSGISDVVIPPGAVTVMYVPLFRNKRCFWHKWGPWRVYFTNTTYYENPSGYTWDEKQNVWVPSGGTGVTTEIKNTGKHQERSCERCGKTEDEVIWRT